MFDVFGRGVKIMTAKEHNKTLGILFLVYLGLQVLGLVVGLVVIIGFSGLFLSEMGTNDAMPLGLMIGMFGVILVVSVILLIPIALAGYKIYKEKPNARIWGIIASIISLLSFPIGTALGVYGLWFLFGEQGKLFYEGGQIGIENPPPPPNSWQ